jgi:hypothetical protein
MLLLHLLKIDHDHFLSVRPNFIILWTQCKVSSWNRFLNHLHATCFKAIARVVWIYLVLRAFFCDIEHSYFYTEGSLTGGSRAVFTKTLLQMSLKLKYLHLFSFKVISEIRRYSSHYGDRLCTHPNHLAVNLLRLPDNRLLRRFQPTDLPDRF